MNPGIFQARVLLLILPTKTLKSQLSFFKGKRNREIRKINTAVSYGTEKLV